MPWIDSTETTSPVDNFMLNVSISLNTIFSLERCSSIFSRMPRGAYINRQRALKGPKCIFGNLVGTSLN